MIFLRQREKKDEYYGMASMALELLVSAILNTTGQGFDGNGMGRRRSEWTKYWALYTGLE
jgi:hypothetical protein